MQSFGRRRVAVQRIHRPRNFLEGQPGDVGGAYAGRIDQEDALRDGLISGANPFGDLTTTILQ